MNPIDNFQKTIWFWTRQIGWLPSYQPFDEDEAIKLLEYTYKKWITLYDTAPIYGFWKSEELLGKALKQERDRIKIISKFWINWNKNGNSFLECTSSSIKQELENSLKRLQTSYIDTYLLHIPSPDIDIPDILKTLNDFKKQKLILSYGVCNTYGKQLEMFLENENSEGEYIEDFYNLIERKAEKLIFPYLQKHHKFIAYSPLYRWVLTTASLQSLLHREEAGIDRVIKNNNLRSISKAKNLYEEVAKRKGISLQKLAIDFLLERPNVETILFWTTKKEHIDAFLNLIQD